MSVLKVTGDEDYVHVLSNNQKKFESVDQEVEDYGTYIAFSDGTLLLGQWNYRTWQYTFKVLYEGTDFRHIDDFGTDSDYPKSEVARLSGDNLHWVSFGYGWHKGS